MSRTAPSPLDAGDAAQAGERLGSLLDQLDRVLLGQREVLEQLLVALLAGGHALLEGVPGVGKTLAAAALARALELRSGRIQFTPDLMPSDVTGVNIYSGADGRFRFQPGPIFAELLLADEINRAPAKTQSALLEAMQESFVTVDGTRHPLGEVFSVIATQNPVEYEGTYPLPEAQLDRFLLHIRVPYPDAAAERALLTASLEGFDAAVPETFGIDAPLARSEWLNLRGRARAVRVEPKLVEYVVEVVRATRDDDQVTLGASPRAAVALLRAGQAQALIEGRDYLTPDDVRRVAVPVLRHRLQVEPDALIEGADAASRVEATLARVASPR